MIGASIETTRELWASSLREVKKRIRPLFAQERAALNAGLSVDGLLGDERRKTGWMRAEAAGDPGPWRQQAVLGRDRWDADALRDLVRDYATEHLADENAVLVIDETGFLKQGKASCGVARQYTGSAGKITNCQIGVFAAYVSRHGHAFIDRALYLPKGWTDDPARLKATYVPGDIGFSTKPQLAAGNAKTSDLFPWSIQEIRRIAQRLARKRIQPADRMVALAARSSGRSTEISSQTKITTVMLGWAVTPPQSAELAGSSGSKAPSPARAMSSGFGKMRGSLSLRPAL